MKYSLRILFSDIEDSPFNETRFAVIGHQKCGKTGHDKTTILFRIPHQPGSLAEALEIFKQNKINLTWIESFPGPRRAVGEANDEKSPAKTPKPEYLFFVDLEGHVEDPKIKRALQSLGSYCQEVTVLGSYPMALTSG